MSKQVREYMERTKEVVPTRGTVHDLGRAITHKRIIIGLYLEGYLTPEIARRTKHSEEACDRYIRAFNKVRMLADRNKSVREGVSQYLFLIIWTTSSFETISTLQNAFSIPFKSKWSISFSSQNFITFRSLLKKM